MIRTDEKIKSNWPDIVVKVDKRKLSLQINMLALTNYNR